MLKKELIKILIAFLVGTAAGIYILLNFSEKELGFLAPVYFVGLLYGWKELLKLLAGLTGASAKGGFFFIGAGGLFGLTLTLFFYFFTMAIILAFGWIIGIYKCIRALMYAHSQDIAIKNAID